MLGSKQSRHRPKVKRKAIIALVYSFVEFLIRKRTQYDTTALESLQSTRVEGDPFVLSLCSLTCVVRAESIRRVEVKVY